MPNSDERLTTFGVLAVIVACELLAIRLSPESRTSFATYKTFIVLVYGPHE